MPFIADIETRDEPRGPIWGPFAVIRNNVERLVALNLGWSAQLVPGVVALVFPGLPLWPRIVLMLTSATLVIATAGPFYALVLAATRGEHLSLELATQLTREFALSGLRALTPLCGVFGLLIWLAILVGPVVPAVMTLVTLTSLLWFLCATYWGPLLLFHPTASAMFLAERSIRLVWRYPAETLATALVTALALLVGMISIGGLVLIVPVVVALLQSERYLDLTGREDAARRGRIA
ncbi:MAG: hypothetical protein ACRDJC_02960 [Thermomicrobiales bacterium]